MYFRRLHINTLRFYNTIIVLPDQPEADKADCHVEMSAPAGTTIVAEAYTFNIELLPKEGGDTEENSIRLNPVQPLNAFPPMLVIEEGIVIDVR